MNKKIMRTFLLSASMAVASTCVAFASGSIGVGDISVYKDEVLMNQMSGKNPIEQGALLACDGKCMLKSEGISLVAADNSKVALRDEIDTFKLFVKEGSVDYAISNNARKVAFYTPQGTYTVAEAVFNASSAPAVKGNVLVDAAGTTEISVTEGRLVFATAEGMKAVDANQKIVLAGLPATATAPGAAGSVATVSGATAGPGLMAGGGVLAGGSVVAAALPAVRSGASDGSASASSSSSNTNDFIPASPSY